GIGFRWGQQPNGGSMYRTFTLSLSVVALAWAATASAAPATLKGAYAFTGTAACLVAPGHVGDPNVPPPLPNPTPGVALPNSGFNAIFQPIDFPNSQSFSRSFSVEGIRTFNGDGTGTGKGTAAGISA